MFIKKTTSLCPHCLKPLEAEVYEEDGRVWIKKECPEHGEFVNTYWSDAELYGRVDQYDSITQDLENPMVNKVAKCPQNCGICSEHESYTVLGLIDVTNRCNLKCPICFANAATSKKLFEPSQDEIRQMLRNLRNEKPVPTPAIQYAGGEPTVRKDLPDLIRMAREEGFSHTQIATNGIRIAKKEGYAKELKEAGLNTVYLQFDGVTEEPYLVARNKNLLDVKKEAIEKCREVGLGIVLVPTVVKGVNDQQVGDIIRFAIENKVGHFVCDSIEEVSVVDEIARSMNVVQKVLLRITPGIDPHTHKKISTGSVDSKFGVAIETGQAYELVEKTLALDNIALDGYHCHIGSQIFEYEPFCDAAGTMIKFIADTNNSSISAAVWV